MFYEKRTNWLMSTNYRCGFQQKLCPGMVGLAKKVSMLEEQLVAAIKLVLIFYDVF